ncbi:MAG: LysE family translocator [Pseudomonadota bacterium]
MPSWEVMAAVALAGLALSVTPGPSMLYVLSRSVGQSRGAGIASAVGLCLGGVVLAIATAFGLAQVFQRSDWLVTGLRYAGSIYLIWLGLDMIRGAKATAEMTYKAEKVQQSSVMSIMWQGVLVELLNPKTILFFALFLPPFISVSDINAGAGQIQLQLLILGILVPLTAIPMDLIVAYTGGSMAGFLNRRRNMRRWMAWGGGAILILIAVNLHLSFI